MSIITVNGKPYFEDPDTQHLIPVPEDHPYPISHSSSTITVTRVTAHFSDNTKAHFIQTEDGFALFSRLPEHNPHHLKRFYTDAEFQSFIRPHITLTPTPPQPFEVLEYPYRDPENLAVLYETLSSGHPQLLRTRESDGTYTFYQIRYHLGRYYTAYSGLDTPLIFHTDSRWKLTYGNKLTNILHNTTEKAKKL